MACTRAHVCPSVPSVRSTRAPSTRAQRRRITARARQPQHRDDGVDDAPAAPVFVRRVALATALAIAPMTIAPEARAKLSGGPTGGIPIEQFQEIPGTKPPILYYDLKGASGATGGVPKGARVAVHYDLKFRNITIGTSRQGAGVTGGTPIGFNVGAKSGSPGGPFIPAFNEGIKGMGVGTVRRMIVPPEYAYGNLEVQEIPPGATITLDLELLSVAKDPIRGGVAGAQQE